MIKKKYIIDSWYKMPFCYVSLSIGVDIWWFKKFIVSFGYICLPNYTRANCVQANHTTLEKIKKIKKLPIEKLWLAMGNCNSVQVNHSCIFRLYATHKVCLRCMFQHAPMCSCYSASIHLNERIKVSKW